MRTPFDRRRESPTERALRANRATPSQELENTLIRLAQRREWNGRVLRTVLASAAAIALMLTATAVGLAGQGGQRALSAAAFAVADLVPTVNEDNGADKVAICHATGSATNPYVLIEPSAAGVFNGHLATSSGGSAGADHQKAEDIIPPFEYQGQTYSENWDPAHIAIFENDCNEVPQYDNPLS
jgi:hypothetical protein